MKYHNIVNIMIFQFKFMNLWNVPPNDLQLSRMLGLKNNKQCKKQKLLWNPINNIVQSTKHLLNIHINFPQP